MMSDESITLYSSDQMRRDWPLANIVSRCCGAGEGGGVRWVRRGARRGEKEPQPQRRGRRGEEGGEMRGAGLTVSREPSVSRGADQGSAAVQAICPASTCSSWCVSLASACRGREGVRRQGTPHVQSLRGALRDWLGEARRARTGRAAERGPQRPAEAIEGRCGRKRAPTGGAPRTSPPPPWAACGASCRQTSRRRTACRGSGRGEPCPGSGWRRRR